MSRFKGQRVAVLGLGIIGSRACSCLATAGWQVACWNRTPKGAAGEAATPEAAIENAAIISIYLKDAPAVRQVVERIAGFLQPGQVVLNHATLDLGTTLWLNEQCLARGCRFLDAPFTGSKLASASAQLIYYLGGDAGLAADLDDYLSATSKSRQICGEVGSATVVKLATNLISACTVQGLAEALAIVTHHGVTADCLVQAVSEHGGASAITGMKLTAMATENFETHFSLSNMGKDTRYMLDLAASAGLHTPAIAAVSQRMAELAANGLGDLDFSAVAKPYLPTA